MAAVSTTLWQAVRSRIRTVLVAEFPSQLPAQATPTIPTVYTVSPRQNAVLPYVVAERVSDVRNQMLSDSAKVTTLDFQVRIVSAASGATPTATHAMYEHAVREILERTKLTGLWDWQVDKINYQQSLTISETDDGLISVQEYTLIGEPTAQP